MNPMSHLESQARRRVEMQMKFNKAATPVTNCVGVKVLIALKQNGGSFYSRNGAYDGFLNYTEKMWATFPYLWGDFYGSCFVTRRF